MGKEENGGGEKGLAGKTGIKKPGTFLSSRDNSNPNVFSKTASNIVLKFISF